jgi:hypothetical protein
LHRYRESTRHEDPAILALFEDHSKKRAKVMKWANASVGVFAQTHPQGARHAQATGAQTMDPWIMSAHHQAAADYPQGDAAAGGGPPAPQMPRGWEPSMGKKPLSPVANPAEHWDGARKRYMSFNGFPIYCKAEHGTFDTPLVSAPTAWSAAGIAGGKAHMHVCMNCGRHGHYPWECPIARSLRQQGFIDGTGYTLKPP